MLNKCMIIGNLGRDPEMRYTANGSAVTEFSVAVNNSFTDRSGERQQETEWFRVVTWNRLAETCAQYLTKGRMVYVEGRLRTRQWEDQQGQKRYTTELVASDVRFLGGGRDGGAAGGGFGSPGFAVGPDNEGDIDPDDLPF